MSSPRWVAVGRIARAHGIKGEVSVQPLSQVEARFQPGSVLFLSEGEDRPIVVASSRPHHQRVLVAFEGVADRTQAEGLGGSYLFVPASSAPELPEGEVWVHELIGCQVVTTSGASLGPIRDVVRTQANDLWVAGQGDDEVLIPALKEVVEEMDMGARRIVVREIPGLTTP